jgi:hypothetical protein
MPFDRRHAAGQVGPPDRAATGQSNCCSHRSSSFFPVLPRLVAFPSRPAPPHRAAAIRREGPNIEPQLQHRGQHHSAAAASAKRRTADCTRNSRTSMRLGDSRSISDKAADSDSSS